MTTIQVLGQDFIITRTGIEITSKVLEITLEEVKYKKFENINGPTYSIGKNEVLIIRYQNGTKSVFEENIKNTNILDSGVTNKNLVSTNLEEDVPIQDTDKNSFNLILELGKSSSSLNNSLSYGLGIGYAIVVKSSRIKIQNELIYRRIGSYYNYYAFMPSLQFSFKEKVSKLNFIGGVGPSVYMIPKPYFQIKSEIGIGANIYAGIKFNRFITKARYTTTNAPYDNLFMFGVDYSF